MSATLRTEQESAPQRRAFWLKTLHRWHWISSALCLISLILFTATGITLNHAAQIKAKPVVTTQERELPDALQAELAASAVPPDTQAPLPAHIQDWLRTELGITRASRDAEWSEAEVYLALPRPGGDGWVSLERDSGAVTYEITDRGWIAYFNDLHKGRDTGPAWAWFIDIFAVACLVFAITGLFLLQLHGGNRPATWPVVGLGVIVPLLLALLFIH